MCKDYRFLRLGRGEYKNIDLNLWDFLVDELILGIIFYLRVKDVQRLALCSSNCSSFLLRQR